MANHPRPPEGIGDDFFEQIFAMPSYSVGLGGVSGGGGGGGDGVVPGGEGNLTGMGLQLNSGDGGQVVSSSSGGSGRQFRDDAEAGGAALATPERDPVPPAYGHAPAAHPLPLVRPNPPPASHQVFHGQPVPRAVAAVAPPRPRVRARRGQATDPHSIAERLRRERIAERIRELQELVPHCSKTDRAAMLDEILDYVKFLRLQVKVLSMSRLGGAGAVAQLVAEIQLPAAEGEAGEGGSSQQVWEKWSTDGTERQVAKLMEEDVGAAMQFLQSKALCIMPISLATTIFHTHHQPEAPMLVKPEPNAPS